MFKRYGILIIASFLFLSPINTNESHAVTISSQTTRIVIKDDEAASVIQNRSHEISVSFDIPSIPATQNVENLDVDESDEEEPSLEELIDELNDQTENFFECPVSQGPIGEILNQPVVQETAAIEKTAQKASKSRLVTVCVDISLDHQKYKHWTGFSYQPDEFYCTVNDMKMVSESTAPVSVSDNKLAISYYSRFENGRESAKKYIYSIDPAVQKLTAQFDWKRKVRIFLDDEAAVLESIEELI